MKSSIPILFLPLGLLPLSLPPMATFSRLSCLVVCVSHFCSLVLVPTVFKEHFQLSPALCKSSSLRTSSLQFKFDVLHLKQISHASGLFLQCLHCLCCLYSLETTLHISLFTIHFSRSKLLRSLVSSIFLSLNALFVIPILFLVSSAHSQSSLTTLPRQ